MIEGMALLVFVIVASVALVALGVVIAARLRVQSAPVEPEPKRREVAVDPRPLPPSHAPLATDQAHRGEAWLAVGRLPVNARQLAVVMAKLPIGTELRAVEPDAVNGEGCVRLGFAHWSFAAPDAARFPNGARVWVSWDGEDPIVSWPVVGE